MSEKNKKELTKTEKYSDTGESNEGSESKDKSSKLPLSSIGDNSGNVLSSRTIPTQTFPIRISDLPLSEQYWPDHLLHPDLRDSRDEATMLTLAKSEPTPTMVDTSKGAIPKRSSILSLLPRILVAQDGSLSIKMPTVRKEDQSSSVPSTGAIPKTINQLAEVCVDGANVNKNANIGARVTGMILHLADDDDEKYAVAGYSELKKQMEDEKAKILKFASNLVEDKSLFLNPGPNHKLWCELTENIKIQKTILSEAAKEAADAEVAAIIAEEEEEEEVEATEVTEVTEATTKAATTVTETLTEAAKAGATETATIEAAEAAVDAALAKATALVAAATKATEEAEVTEAATSVEETATAVAAAGETEATITTEPTAVVKVAKTADAEVTEEPIYDGTQSLYQTLREHAGRSNMTLNSESSEELNLMEPSSDEENDNLRCPGCRRYKCKDKMFFPYKHKNRPTCSICDKSFGRYKTYYEHVAQFHSTIFKFNCKLCSKWFKHASALKLHMVRCSAICMLCNEQFNNINELAKHLTKMFGEPNHKKLKPIIDAKPVRQPYIENAAIKMPSGSDLQSSIEQPRQPTEQLLEPSSSLEASVDREAITEPTNIEELPSNEEEKENLISTEEASSDRQPCSDIEAAIEPAIEHPIEPAIEPEIEPATESIIEPEYSAGSSSNLEERKESTVIRGSRCASIDKEEITEPSNTEELPSNEEAHKEEISSKEQTSSREASSDTEAQHSEEQQSNLEAQIKLIGIKERFCDSDSSNSEELEPSKELVMEPLNIDEPSNIRVKVVYATVEYYESGMPCRKCKRPFYNSESMNAHLRLHEDLLEEQKVVPLQRIYEHCDKCDGKKTKVSPQSINIKPPRYACRQCLRSFYVEAHLINHELVHRYHNQLLRTKCCDLEFRSDTMKLLHKVVHEEPTDIECFDCGLFFKDYSKLLDHKYLETRGEQFNYL